MATARKPIASLRWWIGGLLFASTVINYIEHQTLSLQSENMVATEGLAPRRQPFYRHVAID